ncbi:uncharacterized protein LOC115088526 [Rhinatrema bivittatum]|uniref:uncharacterized protein LOC115088526 n=1 Tax=Rhinatrema bivittatum TaxID=194408 RepID=UPI00112A0DEA|nr:uncharacterized protein LOC115088526 [Rhinatrema bivittatum]
MGATTQLTVLLVVFQTKASNGGGEAELISPRARSSTSTEAATSTDSVLAPDADERRAAPPIQSRRAETSVPRRESLPFVPHRDEPDTRFAGFLQGNLSVNRTAFQRWWTYHLSPGSPLQPLPGNHPLPTALGYLTKLFSTCSITSDRGYPLKTWLIIPLAYPQTGTNVHYNRVPWQTMAVIERTFSQLKTYFCCLNRSRGCLLYNPTKVCEIFLICCMCLNLTRIRALPPPEGLDLEEEAYGLSAEDLQEIQHQTHQLAEEENNTLIQIHFYGEAAFIYNKS